jgi:hypothetical protein
MIKSITSLLSLLFVISSFYYLFFWGRFNIDIFQYIAIEDIIKGVAYSMRPAILLIPAFVIAFATALAFEKSNLGTAVSKTSIQREEKLLRGTIAFCIVCLVVAGSTIYVYLYDNNTKAGILTISSLTILAYATPFASFLFAISMHRLVNIHYDNENSTLRSSDKKNNYGLLIKIRALRDEAKASLPQPHSTITSFIEYTSSGLFAYFLTSAIMLGILNSEKIIKLNEYDFVTGVKASILPKNNRVIYLGAVSTGYIFSDTLMKSCFIVSKDSIPSLNIHHIDASSQQANTAPGLSNNIDKR